jgi:XisH protein
MAKDHLHYRVKDVLIKDGWRITDDPYYLKSWDPDWEIDFGAEKIFAAEKEHLKIAVEVKSFLEISFANEFHKILGQYLNYKASLSQLDNERELYLAVPDYIWNTAFQRKGIQFSLKTYNIKIFVFNPKNNVIEQWIQF